MEKILNTVFWYSVLVVRIVRYGSASVVRIAVTVVWTVWYSNRGLKKVV